MRRFTTQKLIDAEAARTRLGTDQILLLVARSLVIRHLASAYGDQFILKGGALLYQENVGARPRRLIGAGAGLVFSALP